MSVIRQLYSDGSIAKGRRQRSSTFRPTGNKDLDSALSEIYSRLADVEASVREGVTAIETTISVTATTTYTIRHNLNSPVRWYVVDWVGTSNSASFDRSSSSDSNSLVLRANTTGRATIRIESSYGDMR